MTLDVWGWSPAWQMKFEDGAHGDGRFPARVVRQHRDGYVIVSDRGEGPAVITGKLRDSAAGPAGFPAVGDWVAASQTGDGSLFVIHAVIPRAGAFSRKTPGNVTEEQVIAANVDVLFLVTGLDHDFNPRRIERYVTLAWESGARPVVVLNKADLRAEVAGAIAEIEAVALGVDVIAVSALNNTGLDTLRVFIKPGATIALAGSSGVGKSTLINALLGEARLKTAAVRDDDSRGRHTTTHRELVPMPGGGVLVDTPGMRELQLWASEEGLDKSFQDIASFGEACRFRDCTHENEPGCAVQAAVEAGDLPRERLDSYFKLRREIQFLERKQDVKLQALEKAKWKTIHKEMRQHYKRHGGK